MKLYHNLYADLQSARQKTHLLWVSPRDLIQIDSELSEFPNGSIESLCHSAYNATIEKPITFTNIIYLDAKAADDYEAFQIASAVFEALSEDVIGIKKGAFIKALISEGAGIALSQVGVSQLLEMTGVDIRELTETLLDGVSESVADWVTSGAEELVGLTADELNDQLKALSGETLSQIDFNDQKRLDVSKTGKKKIGEIVKNLGTKGNITPQESTARLLELCAAASLEADPKLLFIRNPEYLDPLSLNFLSYLFTMAKDLEHGKTLPVSVLLSFTETESGSFSSRPSPAEIHLKKLRLFAGRYGLLETPSTDAPKLAVREGVFVGRENELGKLNEQSLQSITGDFDLVASIVAAEPGMGKTTLCKKHLEEFFAPPQNITKSELQQRKGIIQLRVNNAPHMSGGTNGILSFSASLESEYHRLVSELAWSSKLVDKATEAAKEKLTFKNALAEAVKFATGGVNLVRIANRFKEMKEARGATTDLHNDLSMQGAHKSSEEEYLDNLVFQLSDIMKLAQRVAGDDTPRPIFLLLDDFQWLDEQTAEFIVRHVLGRYGIRLLATVRNGDLSNALTDAQKKPHRAPYFLTFAHLLKMGGGRCSPH